MPRNHSTPVRGAAITALAAALATLALVVAACGGSTPAAEGPAAVVQDALAKVAAKDVEGLSSLACAGQEDRIRDQLGVPGSLGSDLLPGLDTTQLLDAVELDVSKVQVGEATVEGDAADVPLTGSVKVTFDAEAMRPIVRQVLEGQGQTMTDEQIDGLLQMLDAYGQDVPFNESMHLVREDDGWKICQPD